MADIGRLDDSTLDVRPGFTAPVIRRCDPRGEVLHAPAQRQRLRPLPCQPSHQWLEEHISVGARALFTTSRGIQREIRRVWIGTMLRDDSTIGAATEPWRSECPPNPAMSNQRGPALPFNKYHGLGNDYLVIDPADLPGELTPQQIGRLCDRHYGAGADGVLLGPLPAAAASFGLRIFNPDGSEAEKSGNGLRIFARYLWDRGLVDERPFSVATAGGLVTAQVESGGRMATVAMGRVSFDSREIPVAGPRREALNETLHAGDTALRYCAATLGNPHCVVLCEELSAAEVQRLGPLIETDARFPRRTNVQFMQVLGRDRVRIEIWERGAGYTLASGSSACAAAAVAHRLGLCDAQVTVSMPGGRLEVSIAPDWTATLRGPVTRVWAGVLFEEAFDA